jgi:RNA polymerase sigma-70 factor (ECF subfamily)
MPKKQTKLTNLPQQQAPQATADLSDEQLVSLYLKGDRASLDALIARYMSHVYNFVFKYVHGTAEAEDVTQDVFVKVWKHIGSFNPKFHFKTWLFTIAKRTALDAIKRKGLVPFASLETDDHPNFAENLVDTKPLTDELVARLGDVQMVKRAVSQLDKKYSTVLNMYYSDGLNFREIGEALRESIDTIKTRHRRAIVYLREILEK